MPVINPTPANIRIDASQPFSSGAAAESLDRFQLVYRHSTGLKKASASSIAEARVIGMTFVTSETSGLASFVTNGGIIDSTSNLWSPTEFYFLSTTAGKMCLLSDLAGNDIITLVGYAISATKFKLNILPTGLPRVV